MLLGGGSSWLLGDMQMTYTCAWCGNLFESVAEAAPGPAMDPKKNHGICPACLEALDKQLEARKTKIKELGDDKKL